MNRRIWLALPAVLLVSGLIASATAAGGSTASGPVVKVAFNKKLKKSIVVDKAGRTLYMFTEDTGGLITACTVKGPYGAQCPQLWPPLLARGGAAAAGKGIKAALLGVGKRADGKRQVTYNHHPLYYYRGFGGATGDKKPGDASGQGFEGEWYVLSPKGVPIRSG